MNLFSYIKKRCVSIFFGILLLLPVLGMYVYMYIYSASHITVSFPEDSPKKVLLSGEVSFFFWKNIYTYKKTQVCFDACTFFYVPLFSGKISTESKKYFYKDISLNLPKRSHVFRDISGERKIIFESVSFSKADGVLDEYVNGAQLIQKDNIFFYKDETGEYSIAPLGMEIKHEFTNSFEDISVFLSDDDYYVWTSEKKILENFPISSRFTIKNIHRYKNEWYVVTNYGFFLVRSGEWIKKLPYDDGIFLEDVSWYIKKGENGTTLVKKNNENIQEFFLEGEYFDSMFILEDFLYFSSEKGSDYKRFSLKEIQ